MLTCDRCGKEIDGFRSDYCTAGFYDVTEQTWWSRYAREGERNVCDACMFADPGYRADYGIHPPESEGDVDRAERQQRETAEIREELDAAERIDREIYGESIQTT